MFAGTGAGPGIGTETGSKRLHGSPLDVKSAATLECLGLLASFAIVLHASTCFRVSLSVKALIASPIDS